MSHIRRSSPRTRCYFAFSFGWRMRTVRLVLLAALALCLLTGLLYHGSNDTLSHQESPANLADSARRQNVPQPDLFSDFKLSANAQGNWRHLSKEQVSGLSKLGRVMFLDEERPPPRPRDFLILLWKYGHTTHARHIMQWSDKEVDPFEHCEVKNCKLTYEDAAAEKADLVIIHLHQTKGVDDVPAVRHPAQIWAFSADESPIHTFMFGGRGLPAYNGMFNWSMHYRMDADIPVPYGRAVLKTHAGDGDAFDFGAWQASKSHWPAVAVMGSNCGSNNHRWEYVAELQKHIEVDFYGACGTLTCPGHYGSDCAALARYRFYLSFENSNCDEYITEKLWWNAYAKQAVPIVMGGAPAKRNYAQLLPPHSYINVDDFATPRDLAAYLHYLVSVPAELARYHQWRQYFDVLNEHAYFATRSNFYCRACEALNYNDLAPKTYTDMEAYWTPRTRCTSAWDAPQ